MKLKNVTINNFRCFDSLSLDLDEQLTVLVAKNGQGKSSVLDAIRIGLWSFVSGFDLAHTGYSDPANSVSIDDVRMEKNKSNGQIARQIPCDITLKGGFDLDLAKQLNPVDDWMYRELDWTRFRDSEAKSSKTKNHFSSSYITKYVASKAQDLIRDPNGPVITLPMFGYYGTGRLWSQKKLTKDKKAQSKPSADFYMRLFAYRDCLDPASSYKHFADWFTWIFESYREDIIKQSEKGMLPELDSMWKNTIQVVQQVIDSLLQGTGWHSLEYSVSHEKSLVMTRMAL